MYSLMTTLWAYIVLVLNFFIVKPLEAIGETMLAELMPTEGKRVLFLMSLQTELQKEGVFEEGAILKVNQIMGLVSTEEALGFPMAISSALWRKDRLDRIFRRGIWEQSISDALQKPDILIELCTRIIGVTPEWLIYGPKEVIINDLLTVFKSQKMML